VPSAAQDVDKMIAAWKSLIASLQSWWRASPKLPKRLC